MLALLSSLPILPEVVSSSASGYRRPSILPYLLEADTCLALLKALAFPSPSTPPVCSSTFKISTNPFFPPSADPLWIFFEVLILLLKKVLR